MGFVERYSSQVCALLVTQPALNKLSCFPTMCAISVIPEWQHYIEVIYKIKLVHVCKFAPVFELTPSLKLFQLNRRLLPQKNTLQISLAAMRRQRHKTWLRVAHDRAAKYAS